MAQEGQQNTAPVAQTLQQELETRSEEVQDVSKMFLMIRPFSCPAGLPAAVCQQISRILIQTSSKQTFYQIMLTPNGSYKIMKGVFHEVELQITKVNGVHYEIDATLKNLKKNKLLKTVGKRNVTQGNLIHNVDIAIELLFADLPSIIEEDTKPAPPPVKKVMTLKEKVILQARESPVDDQGLDAFKKRIMQIKSGLDVKTVEVAERIEEEEKELEEETNPAATKKPPKNLSMEAVAPGEKKKSIPLVWFQDLFVGYSKRNQESTETLINNVAFQVKADLTYIWVHYSRGFYIDQAKKHTFEGRFAYGKLNNAPENIELPDYYSFHLNYGYDFQNPKLLLKTGLYQEPIDFVSLPIIGEGLKAGRIQTRWIPLSGRLENELWNKQFFWTFYYHHLFSGQSSYESLKSASYSGNKIGANIEVANVWKNFGLSVNLETLTIESQGERAFNIKGSIYQIGTVYRF